MKLLIVLLIALFAASAYAIKEMTAPDGSRVYVWTEAEMEGLDAGLSKLIAERDKLKQQLRTLERQCV